MGTILVAGAALYSRQGNRTIPGAKLDDAKILSLQKGLNSSEALFVLEERMDQDVMSLMRQTDNKLTPSILLKIARSASLILTREKRQYVLETQREIPIPFVSSSLRFSATIRDYAIEFLDLEFLESLRPPIRKIAETEVFRHFRRGFVVIFEGIGYDLPCTPVPGTDLLEMIVHVDGITPYRLRFNPPPSK